METTALINKELSKNFGQIFSESGDESQDEEKPETEVFPAEQNGGVSGTRKRTKIRSQPKFTVMPPSD